MGRDARLVGARRGSEGREGDLRQSTTDAPLVIVDGDLAHGHRVAAVLEAAGLTAIVVDTLEEAERLALRTSATILNAAGQPPSTTEGGRDPSTPERRGELAAIIDDGAFRAVFQPMVALYKSEVVGYEALTRFDDGTRPDLRFADAKGLGIGAELELATIAAAVAAARALPRGRFISINLSPELLVSHQKELEAAIGELHRDRTVVLELTEHDVVDDYESLRGSLARFDPAVQLSVDDAGAGFSTLRHVVMLEPHYVKLDRTWVCDIDADPTRQALVAGLSHFARTTGCELVAEGIESEPERDKLTELDVSIGQGYLLGVPASSATA
jgi:EAL domain-containing protein (putative c-di-GMP-specific phosphodiesterase class I)